MAVRCHGNQFIYPCFLPIKENFSIVIESLYLAKIKWENLPHRSVKNDNFLAIDILNVLVLKIRIGESQNRIKSTTNARFRRVLVRATSAPFHLEFQCCSRSFRFEYSIIPANT